MKLKPCVQLLLTTRRPRHTRCPRTAAGSELSSACCNPFGLSMACNLAKLFRPTLEPNFGTWHARNYVKRFSAFDICMQWLKLQPRADGQTFSAAIKTISWNCNYLPRPDAHKSVTKVAVLSFGPREIQFASSILSPDKTGIAEKLEREMLKYQIYSTS